MVSTFSMQPFYRQQQLSVDTTGPLAQKYFEEDDSILDETVFDHNALDSGLEMSPPMVNSRRDSFAIGTSLFSPKAEDWQPVDMQPMPSNNPFVSTNPFLRLEPQPSPPQAQQQAPQQQAQQQPQQAQQPQRNPSHPGHPGQHPQAPQTPMVHSGSWPMSASTSANSGVATPVPQFDGMPTEFAATTSMFQRTAMPTQSPPFGSTAGVAMGGLFSPASVAMTASSSLQGSGPAVVSVAKKMPQSPTFRSHNELRRGDGIRKKNARFEIPAERNLNNIDKLIAQSSDEQEIKELKQQKRLLRNRQAALDSRQRKKQHTERLEDEKKHYTAMISEMEQGMERLKLQVNELLQEKQQYTEYIETLTMDKEELIRHHTIESGDLRKKINVLSSHIQDLENAAATGLSNGAGVYGAAGTGAFGDMDSLGMAGAAPWEHVGLFSDMTGVEQSPAQPQQQAPPPPPVEVKQEMQLVPAAPRKEPADAASDKPASQGGLLFMLFLVGAFVLSNRHNTPSIPRVSEDVRVASATLLENVLKDAGVSQTGSVSVDAASAAASAPAQSAAAAVAATPAPSSAAATASWAQPANPGHGLVEPSMLGQLSDQLMQPTEQQTNEQLFSLTAAQYNGVVHYQPPPPHQQQQPERQNQGRSNLAEALASMRTSSKAEVYTRSLLWDQIPSDVVRTFAKMVAECNSQTAAEDGEN